ncbi:ParA family protein [Leptospira sp. GIMC2001]|uniref:ParA family protein n=1 Tax=Leptospira sp. GIMC2001 TaxID=1513297 RepID=UPI00234AD60B|nr:ParA family protein [Leptospira sp. GIMC2001]WCL51479.1 ParA family protein [Leptospira sp. GIMC2001]
MIISVASLKGGVGKTTISTFLAQAFAARGFSVQLIDLDHNNNLTDFFLREIDSNELESRSIFKVLQGYLSIEAANFTLPSGIKIVPATPTLSNLDSTLGSDPGLTFRFREDLRSLESDIIIIDIHNAKHLGLYLALYASDIVLSPFTLNRWTYQGSIDIQTEVEKASKTIKEKIQFIGVRSNLTDKKSLELDNVTDLKIAKTTIHRSEAIETASSIAEFLNPNTKAFKEFLSLSEEIF